jgi:hypothetical protein
MTPAELTCAPPNAALASVLEKFPEAPVRIRKLFYRNPSFQSLCEDYRDCLTAWHYWQGGTAPQAPALCRSYADLLKELEHEVRQYLELENSAGLRPGKG